MMGPVSQRWDRPFLLAIDICITYNYDIEAVGGDLIIKEAFMKKESKNKMGKLLKQYQDDVIVWWKTEEDEKKRVHYQKLVYAIDTVLDSFKENLETDEW